MTFVSDTLDRRTPYDPQRRRLGWMEMLIAWREGVQVPCARAMLGRQVRLTPDQIVAIRKGRRKGLYHHVRDRIDEVFVVLARRAVEDFALEMAAAAASGRAPDPLLEAEAQALAALIREAGAARRAAADGEAGSW